jgi:hypothetical protein
MTHEGSLTTVKQALALWAVLTAWAVMLLLVTAYTVGVHVTEAKYREQAAILRDGIAMLEYGMWRAQQANAAADSVWRLVVRMPQE